MTIWMVVIGAQEALTNLVFEARDREDRAIKVCGDPI
jgi:hypothetical protein